MTGLPWHYFTSGYDGEVMFLRCDCGWNDEEPMGQWAAKWIHDRTFARQWQQFKAHNTATHPETYPSLRALRPDEEQELRARQERAVKSTQRGWVAP